MRIYELEGRYYTPPSPPTDSHSQGSYALASSGRIVIVCRTTGRMWPCPPKERPYDRDYVIKLEPRDPLGRIKSTVQLWPHVIET